MKEPADCHEGHVVSTGERPFTDVLQDRRYWVIHLLTVPSLFAASFFCVLSGLGTFLAGAMSKVNLEILNNRF